MRPSIAASKCSVQASPSSGAAGPRAQGPVTFATRAGCAALLGVALALAAAIVVLAARGCMQNVRPEAPAMPPPAAPSHAP